MPPSRTRGIPIHSGWKVPVLLSGAPAAAAGLGLKTNLAGWWELSEASGNRADSHTNGLTLTDNNTVTSAAGIGGAGTAASFAAASSESLSCVDAAAFAFTTAMTASFWVYQDTLALDRVFLGKWTYQTDGEWAIQSGTSPADSGDITIFLATSAGDNGGGCRMNFTDIDMSATTWYHIAIIFDGSLSGDANRLKVYVNNVQKTLTVDAGAVPASLVNGTADFNLGKFGGSITRYYNGRMAKVGLWNIALTAGNVSSLYNGGTGLTYAGLT